MSYISREAAIDAVMSVEPFALMDFEGKVFGAGQKTDDVVKALEQLPSADVVEVIKCKDCKHHYTKSLLCEVWSRYGTVATLDTDYCSYAERRTDETDYRKE